MAGLLLSGPAGAGKSQEARRALDESPGPAVIADFQSIYAALLLLERQPNGRYPERRPEHDHLIPLVEYTRQVIITGAVTRDLFVITTNSDGSGERRATLLALLGPGAIERVIDPGRDVVTARLSVGGELSAQCG